MSRKLYRCWNNMKLRCSDKTRKDSIHYSLKGITICPEWMVFKGFESWALANGYREGLSIERLDVDKGYNPENCVWIPVSEQSRNRSSNVLLTLNGETKILTDWSRQTCIPARTITSRLKAGFSVEDALTMKKNRLLKSELYEFNGEMYTNAQFAALFNIHRAISSRMLKAGLTTYQIATKYKFNQSKNL